MLPILHVVMKTLDKTCCHVYIYPKCLYDNITTVGYIMDKEQLDLIIKHRSELMDLIESLMHNESVAFTDPVLRELILIRQSYDLIIERSE